ncbi:MAG: phosphotransferase enzyme family protein [Egibacteraceae bacterium]
MSSVAVEGRTFTVQVCTWIGSPIYPMSDMRLLGRCLASLHTELQRSSQDFSDRQLSFERAEPPASTSMDQELPPWYVARHIWRERILAWLHLQAGHLPSQPIHGDMHWANIVPTAGGFGFIDFDKVMFAPPVFDLAKLIATGFFAIGSQVRFRARRAAKVLEGYNEVRRLSEKELAALEGLALLLNEETARLGTVYGVDEYRDRAAAVANWWIARRRRRVGNPLGIRDLFDPIPTNLETQRQLALWSEHDTGHYLDSRGAYEQY